MKIGFKRKYGIWMSINVCTECDKSITDDERLNNHGVCPKCGFLDSETLCSTYAVVLRRVTFSHINWWVLVSYYTWIGKSKKDNDWLKKHSKQLRKHNL